MATEQGDREHSPDKHEGGVPARRGGPGSRLKWATVTTQCQGKR